MSGDRKAAEGPLVAALAFQGHILSGVSRTFALTIPSLPEALRVPVMNAYLLCRIADTIEDDPGLSLQEKRSSGREFVEIVAGQKSSGTFPDQLAARLGPETLDSERELVARTPDVVRVTHNFDAVQRQALIRCVSLMSEGMHRFQQESGLQGLGSQRHMDEYCYFVAGVVGEMLTELFCAFSGTIARRRARLMRLAPSFGQGLQMTNILKDIRTDRARGVCWLPRSAFGLCPESGSDLLDEIDESRLRAGMEQLVTTAHGHLRNALSYTLLIPRRHLGIRRFCLWALGMAVPTLDNIYRNPLFASGDEVKISRSEVRRIVRQYGLMAGSDTLLSMLFNRASCNLPEAEPGVALTLEEISSNASDGRRATSVRDSAKAG